MKTPNFLIPGASRSGTTSLYYYLRSHPDVFMPEKKELRYFDRNDNFGDQRAYLENFKCSNGEKIVGESSPPYFYNFVIDEDGNYTFDFETPAERISEFNSDMKILITLRNPVDRAYSQYWKNRNNNSSNEGKSYLQVCKEEAEGDKIIEERDQCFLYKNKYSIHLKPWFENFPDDQLKIIIFEEWIQNREEVLEEICEFLGVDSNYDFSDVLNEEKNSSRIYRSRLFKHFYRRNPVLKHIYRSYILDTGLEKLVKRFTHQKGYSDMSEEAREFVYGHLKEDIERTEAMLERDLDVWRP